ncbi:MAG: hypothetical protein NXI18_21510, partial [Alphaproteobacteria bacterium]|nr:hypothetical protein [Alphaproteobacteria bacterium]
MTRGQKIIRNKVGVLELAKQFGNVSQACKIMGYSALRYAGGSARPPTPPTGTLPEKSHSGWTEVGGRTSRPCTNVQTGPFNRADQEAVSLQRSQLVYETGEIQLIKTKTRPRVIVASEDAWGTLRGTPHRLDSLFVFNTQAGGPYRNFASRFREIGQRAGTSFRCHDLRHEFAIR